MSEYHLLTGSPQKTMLCDLNYQYIPKLINHDIWGYDMSLPKSPQVECALLLLRHGKKWGKLKHCRLAEDRRHRYRLGMKKWTEEAIKEHILGSRYKILRSIKKRGFDSKRNSLQPVTVLKEPFWKTRFDFHTDWLKGYEIYHGGRRCAAMYALGYEQVPVLWAQDKKPGSKNSGKFERKVQRLFK